MKRLIFAALILCFGASVHAQILNKNIEQVRYADQFPGSPDIGLQVMNAYNDLPATGGVIEIPASASCYAISTPIVINKPVVLRGHGIGTTSQGQLNTGIEPTCLQWSGTTGVAVTVGVGISGSFLNGVSLENFALHGGGGSSVGILLQGGDSTTQLQNIFLRGVVVKGFYNGIEVRDNAYLLKAYGVQTTANGHNGWDIDISQPPIGDGKGLPSQLRFIDCLSLQNGFIGFNVVSAASAEFHGVTSANNQYGIVANPVVSVFGGSFENNSTTGIWLRGPSSVVIGAGIPSNHSYGIALASTANHSLLSGILSGNNTLQDIFIDPAATDVMLLELDPSLTVSGPNVGYTARTTSSAGALAGYVIVRINGTDYKVPYYH